MKTTHSLDSILGDFNPTTGLEGEKLGSSITIWVPTDYKARYDKLQQRSKRGFSKKLRELFIAAIDLTESKAA